MALDPKKLEAQATLSDHLKFRPIPIWDPVPWWYFEHLNVNERANLAKIQVQHQRELLQSQIKALDAAEKLLR